MGVRKDYIAYGRFMLRAPALSVGVLEDLPIAPEQLKQWLQVRWQDNLVQEAINLASVNLSDKLEILFRVGLDLEQERKVLLSLLRYIIRYSTRCTPFGTFAGFLMGNIGKASEIKLSNTCDFHAHARPDMEVLMEISRYLETIPEIRNNLTYSGNSTLYPVGSDWHYIEVRPTVSAGKKKYDIVSIQDNEVIGLLLDFCKTGRRLTEIYSKLKDDGWSIGDIGPFVDQLLDNQILISNLYPVVCGPHYLDCLLRELSSITAASQAFSSLSKLSEIMLKYQCPGALSTITPDVISSLKTFPLQFTPNHVVQVDLELRADKPLLSESTTSQVLLGLRLLKALTSRTHADRLKDFRLAFLKRFGSRKVPLSIALDSETGIGPDGSPAGYWSHPAPWIDNFNWGPDHRVAVFAGDLGNPWLTGKLYAALRMNQMYIDIDQSDFKEIGIHDGHWPHQMTAIFEMFKEPLQEEWQVHLLQGSSGNPSYLMGRFAGNQSAETEEWTRQLIEDEQSRKPAELFAEVVHLPADRTGNVLHRPSFISYEIPYLARSHKGIEQQIPLSSLLISVEQDRVILTSAVNGMRVHPHITNAYNPEMEYLPVYQLLHRISVQDEQGPFIPGWGASAGNAPFLPGIRFKSLLVAAPRWLLKCCEIRQWIHRDRNEVDIAGLQSWQKHRGMPDDMLLDMGDQELFFSWKNQNLILALWEVIRHLDSIRVRPFFSTGETPVKSENGFHANQFIISFKRK